MNVATLAQHDALEKRIARLEARGVSMGSAWIPIAESPLKARKTRRLIAAGKLEASRVGRRLYVRVADVDAFLEARIVKHEPKPVAVPEGASVAEFCEANLHLLRGGKTRAA